MAIKYEKITAGSMLLDVHAYQAGNTTMRKLGCWPVYVVEIVKDGAIVHWNSRYNPATFWPKERLSKLYLKPPAAYRRQHPNSTEEGFLA